MNQIEVLNVLNDIVGVDVIRTRGLYFCSPIMAFCLSHPRRIYIFSLVLIIDVSYFYLYFHSTSLVW